MMNDDSEKKTTEKIHVRPIFPVLSVSTNRLLYQLRQPLIHSFPARKGPSSKLGMQSRMNPQDQLAGIRLLRLCSVCPALVKKGIQSDLSLAEQAANVPRRKDNPAAQLDKLTAKHVMFWIVVNSCPTTIDLDTVHHGFKPFFGQVKNILTWQPHEENKKNRT